MTYDQIWRVRRARRAVRNVVRHRERLEVRLGPETLAARDQELCEQQQMKKAEAALLKEMCMQREVKRAKRTKIFPNTFDVLQIHQYRDPLQYKVKENTIESVSESELNSKTFTSQIISQDRLDAIRQAISEHTKEGTRRRQPRWHSSHVDAAVSCDENLTGIAVVHKAHQQHWASPWTVRGYRMYASLDRTDAEVWAIWQALQVV